MEWLSKADAQRLSEDRLAEGEDDDLYCPSCLCKCTKTEEDGEVMVVCPNDLCLFEE